MKKANDKVFGLLAMANGIQIIVLTIRNIKLTKERKKDNEYWARLRANRDAIVGKWFVNEQIGQAMFEEYIVGRDKIDDIDD